MTDHGPLIQDAPSKKYWNPARFAALGESAEEKGWAVCILNQPIENRGQFLKICEQAAVIVCGDGGANRLKDLNLSEAEEAKCRVSAVCGDFDSVRPEVLEYYGHKGAAIVHDADQYSTDLMKCLKFIEQWVQDASEQGRIELSAPLDVAIFAGLGGRADQSFSLVNQLYLKPSSQSARGIGEFYILAAESMIFLLEGGENVILAPVGPGLFTPDTGIIPVGRPSVITTSGFEWDVTGWPTEFGGQVSTSNHIVSDSVVVETSERVLFTLEFDLTKQ